MNLFTVEVRERVHNFTVNNFGGIVTNILAYISIVSTLAKKLYITKRSWVGVRKML